MKHLLLPLALLLCWSPLASARPSGTTASTSLVYQAPATLADRTEVSVVRTRLAGSGSLHSSRSLRVGWSLDLTRHDYRFDGTGMAAADHPWGEIWQAGFGLSFLHPFNRQWLLMAAPSVGFTGDADAEADRSLNYGTLVNVAWQRSEGLQLGFGAALFRDLDEFKAFPVLLVDWQITPGWRLANPLRAGVTGPAGLELSWRPQGDWEWGLGGAWRSLRFRLDDEGPAPGGIGEENLVPVWVRGVRDFGSLRLAVYAGMSLEGELRLENRRGDTLSEQRYDTAPFGAIYLSGSF